MPQETDRLKLPLPLGNENVTRESINGIFEKIDAGVATQEDLDTLREAVSKMDIPDASLTQKGKVQLSDAINSTVKDKAATPSAVKLAFDEATAAKLLGVEQKNNVVAALNSIGVTASTSESWAQLVSKLTTVVRSTGNATEAQVLTSATFSNVAGNSRIGTMPNRSAENHHMPAIDSTLWVGDRVFLRPPNGYYSGESWVTTPTPTLIPENIRRGVSTIGGVVGTLDPSNSGMVLSQYTSHRDKPVDSGRAFEFTVVEKPAGAKQLFLFPNIQSSTPPVSFWAQYNGTTTFTYVAVDEKGTIWNFMSFFGYGNQSRTYINSQYLISSIDRTIHTFSASYPFTVANAPENFDMEGIVKIVGRATGNTPTTNFNFESNYNYIYG
ncbi:tail fiber protein [Paenibacillus sp. 7523-1]|uniref:tail fiber protein n=1 Tax=Paenibacillus sp. 7523-1 TaxID=2022550 RepID=UPI000BA716A3|nr:phage tail protein [Paenibacillus sp. 7523-1]